MCLIHEDRLILRHDAIIFSELLSNSYWYIEGKTNLEQEEQKWQQYML